MAFQCRRFSVEQELLPDQICFAGASPTAAAASQPFGDGVFMRLMALPKGRVLLARALRLLYAPLSAGWVPPPELNGPRPIPAPIRGCSPAMRLAWALLRNISYLFGGHVAASEGLALRQGPQLDAQEVRPAGTPPSFNDFICACISQGPHLLVRSAIKDGLLCSIPSGFSQGL